jgi:hypothetical protein
MLVSTCASPRQRSGLNTLPTKPLSTYLCVFEDDVLAGEAAQSLLDGEAAYAVVSAPRLHAPMRQPAQCTHTLALFHRPARLALELPSCPSEPLPGPPGATRKRVLDKRRLCSPVRACLRSGHFVVELKRRWSSNPPGFSFVGDAAGVEAVASLPGLVALEEQPAFVVDWGPDVGATNDDASAGVGRQLELRGDSASSGYGGDASASTSESSSPSAPPSPSPEPQPWHLDRLDALPGSPTTLDGAYSRHPVFDGSGVVVYVFDTGVAPHEDFGGRVVAGPNFAADGRESDLLCMEHGTHVRVCTLCAVHPAKQTAVDPFGHDARGTNRTRKTRT